MGAICDEHIIQVELDYIKEIRGYISRTEKYVTLVKDRGCWLKLTSALNVIEDTSYSISYYIDNEYPSEVSGKYLFTYGLLQSLYVQMDAIRAISKSLLKQDIDFKEKYPEAYIVREMRNDVVGHPTGRANNYYYLAQNSLSKWSFYYIKESSTNENGVKSFSVNVITAISDVAKCINDVLKRIVELLNKELKEFKDKYKDRKLADIFHLLMYAREKVLLNEDYSCSLYENTKSMVMNLKKELCDRYESIDNCNSFKYTIDDVDRLYDLLDNGIKRMPYDIQETAEKYLLECLFAKLEDLKQMCEEMDASFELDDNQT